jgi:hypothetical protein
VTRNAPTLRRPARRNRDGTIGFVSLTILT